MNSQGLLGALLQYWTIEDKPRLYRRNTWFDDHKPSEYTMNRFLFYTVFTVVVLIVGMMIGGLF